VRVLKARLAAHTAAAAELEAAAAEAAAAAADCSALSSAAAAQKIQLTQQDQRVAALTDQARLHGSPFHSSRVFCLTEKHHIPPMCKDVFVHKLAASVCLLSLLRLSVLPIRTHANWLWAIGDSACVAVPLEGLWTCCCLCEAPLRA